MFSYLKTVKTHSRNTTAEVYSQSLILRITKYSQDFYILESIKRFGKTCSAREIILC